MNIFDTWDDRQEINNLQSNGQLGFLIVWDETTLNMAYQDKKMEFDQVPTPTLFEGMAQEVFNREDDYDFIWFCPNSV